MNCNTTPIAFCYRTTVVAYHKPTPLRLKWRFFPILLYELNELSLISKTTPMLWTGFSRKLFSTWPAPTVCCVTLYKKRLFNIARSPQSHPFKGGRRFFKRRLERATQMKVNPSASKLNSHSITSSFKSVKLRCKVPLIVVTEAQCPHRCF